MKRRSETSEAIEPTTDPLDRHRRKCQVCHHPDREEIEEEFVNWRTAWHLADAYGIQDYRSIYRHATATGLIHARRANLRWALDAILEHGPGHVNADSVIRAIRAYSCLDENNKWTEPPTEVIFSVADRRIPSSARSHLTLSVDQARENSEGLVGRAFRRDINAAGSGASAPDASGESPDSGIAPAQQTPESAA